MIMMTMMRMRMMAPCRKSRVVVVAVIGVAIIGRKPISIAYIALRYIVYASSEEGGGGGFHYQYYYYYYYHYYYYHSLSSQYHK